MKKVYLLTGKPGTGKTSLIKRLVADMRADAGGFYTEEIRDGGLRQGFKLVTLDGEEALLAHTSIRGQNRVSKYGVDTDALDRVGVAALSRALSERRMVVIDEIGKMELLSAAFRDIVSDIIGSGLKVVGTIMSNPNPWADDIKHRPQVKLITVTRDNHPQILKELSTWLKS